jgi:hypothetical protein
MKIKLQLFSDFANDILPHEISYLMQVQQFQDKDNLAILQRVEYNCLHTRTPVPFDTSIDKRKYSNVKLWITHKLDQIDVDKHLLYINDMDHKIMTDSISPEEEKGLLQAMARYNKPYFYFMKFYELALRYRHFLLIRMRYKDYDVVQEFIEKQKAAYHTSREVDETLHEATRDIIAHYANNTKESRKWEQWLLDTFYNESLDGIHRYFAVVRLTFMYFNYREYDKLKEVYDALDVMMKQGGFYSRRILFNYYANCVLLHSKFDVLQQAEEYGYLSIKQKNTDHLHYLNNYSAILLRQGKINEALTLMKQSFPKLRHTNNFHNKIGFISFYIKCLNLNGQPQDGERMADSFLRDNKDQILSQRWHIFFVSYFQSLIMQEKYDKLLKTCKRYNIIAKEAEYSQRPNYLPTLHWYYNISQYMESQLDEEQLVEHLVQTGLPHAGNEHKSRLLHDLLNEIKYPIPHLVAKVKSMLKYSAVNA